MKYLNTLLVLLILGLSVYLATMFLKNFVYPNTYLADVDMSSKNRNQVEQFLQSQSQQTVELKISNRIYRFSYEDMGVYYSQEAAYNDIFEPNSNIFLRVPNYLSSYSTERIISPPLKFSQDYYSFIDSSVFTFIDAQTNEGKQYMMNAETLKTQLELHFGSDQPIEVGLREYTQTEIDPSLYARRLNAIIDEPVELIVTDGQKSSEVTLSRAEVMGVSSVRMDPNTAAVDISINSSSLNDIIQQYKTQIEGADSDRIKEHIRQDFINLLRNRLEGQDADVIMAHVSDTTNTNGDRAERYIEIDLSEKMVYLFDTGKLVETVPALSDICSALEPGEHTVIQKTRSLYAADDDVWVPYWVGFSLNDNTNTILGINEAPYRKEDNRGKPQIKEGVPQSKACVSLPIGRAENVYGFSSIHMPVYIFE